MIGASYESVQSKKILPIERAIKNMPCSPTTLAQQNASSVFIFSSFHNYLLYRP